MCMLTPTKEAINAAMTYGREKLGQATLKPEQKTAISIFALGKDKTSGMLNIVGASLSKQINYE